MKQLKKTLLTLALLLTAATGAWADQLASSYSSNATLNAVTVSASMEVTIATGVTVTINNGLNITSGTLTVKGPGTLVVNGKAGSNGGYNGMGNGGNGANGAAAISGNIIVQGGATVKATGGNGGNGGYSEVETGGNGAQGGAAITGEVTIQDASTLEATGGNGGSGGGSGDGSGGNGANGANAIGGTLNYKGGTVTANGGNGGSGGGSEGGEGGSGGSAGKAFTTSVNFVSSDYILTDGSNAITATQVTSKKKVVISPKVAVTGVTLAPTSATLTLGETETVTLTATVAPNDATDPTVKWNVTAGADKVKLYKDENCSTEVGTAATDVLTVYAKGLAVGDATVTVTSNDDATKTAACTVTVIPTATPVPLTWDAATPNTATLTNGMPAGNVTVSVEYFAQAEFATSTDGTLAPAPIPNVPANTDAPIVTAGTVANIGTTEVKQGTLKYFVIQPTDNTIPDAPTYDTEGWSENVPTANELKQGDVYVWYYIEGAEPATIAERTDANTRSDSDIKPLGANGIVTLDPEPTYDVSLNKTDLAEGEPALWSAKSTKVAEVNLGEADLKGVKKSETVTVTYSGTKKIIGVKAEKKATPLTIEAITPGTIVVYIEGSEGTFSAGMKYSKDGGTTKTLITSTTLIEGLKAGDKVQFYGNGTQTQAYYIQNGVRVRINGSGEGFQTKVYGNIMSLLDEEGFATKTDLPAGNVFRGLFSYNLTLSDASELLLPATNLTTYCYAYLFQGCQLLTAVPKLPATTLATSCYEGMFFGCSSLTTAPKLPATTLAESCYGGMFYNCSSLTTAYVKAAYTVGSGECGAMFNGCSATGAVLHTTPDNKASWETMMGTGKTWSKWTVADDWQE